MTEVLLVVLIAVLLFGGGAVLSALTGFIGLLAGGLAFIFVCIWLRIDPWSVIIGAPWAILAIGFIGWVTRPLRRSWEAKREAKEEHRVLADFREYLEQTTLPNPDIMVEKIRQRKSLSDHDLESTLGLFRRHRVYGLRPAIDGTRYLLLELGKRLNDRNRDASNG